MVALRALQKSAAAAAFACICLPVSAATVGHSQSLAFQESLVFGEELGPGFDLSDVVTATVTQTGADSARFDFAFTGSTGSVLFAGLFLGADTDFEHHSGGEIIQNTANTRSIFGDRDIPRGLSFGNGLFGFRDGDTLSFSLSTAGLDIEDWTSFLHEGSHSGLFGGLAYVSGDSASVFGVTGPGIPVIASMPLPAGGILILTGLGAMIVLRRKLRA